MSPGLPGALAAPSGVSGLEQSELEQTGDRPPPFLPRFFVACQRTDPGPLTELPGQGDQTLEVLPLEFGP